MPQALTYRGWAGGTNKKLPSDQILDTEVTVAQNVELDSRANLRTRPGTVDVSNGTSLTKRVTSIFYFEKSDGTNAVFATENNSVRRWNESTGWPALAIDVGASFSSLPTDATWYWRTFNDKAIGVNGSVAGGGVANAVKIDSAASGAKLKDLSSDSAQPNMLYIEVANSRVFCVDADSPNTVTASKLGDAEASDSWSATGIAGFYSVNVGGDEGGAITGLRLYRGQLIVFKRRKIYTISFGSPNTDTSQWDISLLVDGVGCISNNSVQEVLGDLIFLSDEGIMSMQKLLSSGGDVERALLSENIPALRQVPRLREDYPSVVLPEKSQYWIAIPTSDANKNGVVWVMDYSLLSVNGRVAWTNFLGGPVGASLAQVIDDNGDFRVFIGTEAESGASDILEYHNDASCTGAGSSCFRDKSALYQTWIVTKSFNLGEPLFRKQLHRFGVEFGALTDPLSLRVRLSLDGDDANSRWWDLAFSGLVSGATWDVDDWDTGKWASEVSPNTDVWRKVTGLRRFQQAQFGFQVSSIDQAVSLKNISLSVSKLTHRRASDV